MFRLTIIVAIFLSSFASADFDVLSFPTKPDERVTVGSFCDEKDPDFVGYRYKEKIPFCIRNVSRHLKARIYRMYGVSERCRHEYTIDHYIPLSMGGSNADDNLWPEHKKVKATRQNLEQSLYLELSNGNIKQHDAVQMVTEAKNNPPRVEPTDCK